MSEHPKLKASSNLLTVATVIIVGLPPACLRFVGVFFFLAIGFFTTALDGFGMVIPF
jgi:hypothetical protein